MDPTQPVILGAARTAVGAFGGSLAGTSAVELGCHAVRAALERSGVPPDHVDEVLLGNVLSAGLGQNVARQAALKAGIPIEVPATSVNKVCGSGLEAVALAARAIRCGDAEVVVAGGTENMSRAPYLLEDARQGLRMGDGRLVDSMLRDGLCDYELDIHMGVTAEHIAREQGITRADLDAFALASQEKAARAIQGGLFAEEIVPVDVAKGRERVAFAVDEHPRAVTAEKLTALNPAFQGDGVVTAGNSSGINDGAAAVVVASASKARELGVEPLARIVSAASAGVAPRVMGLGPIPATRKALAQAGLAMDDLDLVEANEAFAAQCVAVARELGIPDEKLNVHGGAIALGHPIGASGARILVTLLYAMRRRDARRGLATLCIGGGQGIAMVIERGR